MVKQKIIQSAILLAISIQLSACSYVHSEWFKAAPPRKVVTITSKPMPPVEDIFNDNEAISKSTFVQYKQMVLDTFDQIKGKNQSRLTMDEVSELARIGLAKLADDEKTSVDRVRSALTLLGFKGGVSRDQVVALLNWVDDNRVQGRAFYQTLFQSDTHDLNSKSLIRLLQFIGSLVELGGGDALTTAQVTEMIKPWLPKNYVHAIKAMPSGVNLVISVFSSLCGDRVDPTMWNAQKNGRCLRDLVAHFQGTAPVFDFMFNGLNPITEKAKLVAANAVLVDKVESWMKDHNHPTFPTDRVQVFSEELGIPQPHKFFELTKWIPRLNPQSTAESFSPSFFIDIAHVLQNWISTFTSATESTRENVTCSFAEWRKCKFQGEYDSASRLYNDEYATLVRDNNLDFISKVSFYDSISDYLIKAFDPSGNGLVGSDITDLISLVVELLDSNAFAQNIILQIQEKPIDNSTTEDSIARLKRQGLSEVAAMAADLVPDRDGGKRSLFKKITSTIYDADKHPTFTIDRLGITSFIYVYDLLGTLRNEYMRSYDFAPVEVGSNTRIKRRRIVELLPRMLHDHFPRIYNECLDWGFERTCGVVYTEVLASSAKGTDYLAPSDLDILNLTSILLESMMNRCDRNHDDVLSTNLMDGFDEKSCALTVSTTLAKRLMNANLVDNNPKTQKLLGILNWLAPARWAAKVALERGSLEGIGIRAVPLVSLVSGPARLGGVFSLAAEFMNGDKVKAIEAGVMGEHKDVGDELVYLNQMTEKYLPSHSWALRTSAAARLLYGPGKTTPIDVP